MSYGTRELFKIYNINFPNKSFENESPNLKTKIPLEDMELADYLLTGKEPKSAIGQFLLDKLLAKDDS